MPEKPASAGIANAGIRLLILLFAAAVLLALTNAVTRGPITAANLAGAEAARQQVMPQADAFEAIEWTARPDAALYPDLEEAYRALAGGRPIGSVFLLKPSGYKAEIPVTVGITDDGEITGVAIGDISETAGLGSKVKDPPFLSQFDRLPVPNLTTQVDTISGATISSRACVNAVRQAAALWTALAQEVRPDE